MNLYSIAVSNNILPSGNRVEEIISSNIISATRHVQDTLNETEYIKYVELLKRGIRLDRDSEEIVDTIVKYTTARVGERISNIMDKTYLSSNSSVVTVTDSGTFAMKEGKATLTVLNSDGSFNGTIVQVTVI